MYKKLLSIVLTISLISTSFSIVSFANKDENNLQLALTAPSEVFDNRVSNSIIESPSLVASPALPPSINNQSTANISQEKITIDSVSQTFLQRCKEKCLNIFSSVISQTFNSIPLCTAFAGIDVLLSAIGSYFNGKELQWSKWINDAKSSVIQNVSFNALGTTICIMFNISDESIGGKSIRMLIPIFTDFALPAIKSCCTK